LLESVDVTKRQDLVDLRNRVVATMPPIGGVANGANVLSDQNFSDMTYDTFMQVQRPKVDGSKNLAEVFSGDALDFFLMFSSISGTTGQRNQANYAAANNVSTTKLRVSISTELTLSSVHDWFGRTNAGPQQTCRRHRHWNDHRHWCGFCSHGR
jgi:hypothetical protein